MKRREFFRSIAGVVAGALGMTLPVSGATRGVYPPGTTYYIFDNRKVIAVLPPDSPYADPHWRNYTSRYSGIGRQELNRRLRQMLMKAKFQPPLSASAPSA